MQQEKTKTLIIDGKFLCGACSTNIISFDKIEMMTHLQESVMSTILSAFDVHVCPKDEINNALEKIEMLINYAYEKGFHELGYNPTQVIKNYLPMNPIEIPKPLLDSKDYVVLHKKDAKEILVELETIKKEYGDCEHEVNLCVCSLNSIIGMLEEKIGEI